MINSYVPTSYRQRFAVGLIIVLFASALTACGGGSSGGGDSASSYKGKETPAEINDDNYESLADAAIEGSGAAINEDEPYDPDDDYPVAAKTSAGQVTMSEQQREWLTDLHQQVLDRIGGLPETSSAINTNLPGDCGGSVGVSFSGKNNSNMTFRYNNFCTQEGAENITVNGVVNYLTTAAITEIHYQNFTVRSSVDGVLQRINNMIVRCETNGAITECTINSDFVGANGVIYRLRNVDVTDNGGSYDVSATVYHPEHGSVTFTAVGLVACSGGGFSDGTITVTSTVAGATGEVVVTFNANCTSNINYSSL